MRVSELFRACMLDMQLNNASTKTLKNYSTTLNSFMRAVGDISVEFIDFNTIITWKLYLEETGKSNTTICGYLSTLRKVLIFGKRQGLRVVDTDIIQRPKIIQTTPNFVQPGNVSQMLAAAPTIRDRALISALWSSGGRISEVLSLRREDVEKRKCIVIGKGGKEVTLYIDDQAYSTIKAYLSQRTDEIPFVFISAQRRRLGIQRAEQIISQIAAEAGIEQRITPHAFRHGYATDLLENGCDIRTVQELLHHTNITTTMRYTHVSDKRKDNSYIRYHTVGY